MFLFCNMPGSASDGREEERETSPAEDIEHMCACRAESETFSDNCTCFKADTQSFRSQSKHTYKEGGHQTERHFRGDDKFLVKRSREDPALLTGLMLGCVGEYIPATVQITSEGMHHEHTSLPHTISIPHHNISIPHYTISCYEIPSQTTPYH